MAIRMHKAPVFGLAYLLGIKLMPRIRNLKVWFSLNQIAQQSMSILMDYLVNLLIGN